MTDSSIDEEPKNLMIFTREQSHTNYERMTSIMKGNIIQTGRGQT